jgi:hypothetical protein
MISGNLRQRHIIPNNPEQHKIILMFQAGPDDSRYFQAKSKNSKHFPATTGNLHESPPPFPYPSLACFCILALNFTNHPWPSLPWPSLAFPGLHWHPLVGEARERQGRPGGGQGRPAILNNCHRYSPLNNALFNPFIGLNSLLIIP